MKWDTIGEYVTWSVIALAAITYILFWAAVIITILYIAWKAVLG